MRRTIKAAFFGLISMAFVGSAIADITFVSWGGAYTASQQKAYEIGRASCRERV